MGLLASGMAAFGMRSDAPMPTPADTAPVVATSASEAMPFYPEQSVLADLAGLSIFAAQTPDSLAQSDPRSDIEKTYLDDWLEPKTPPPPKPEPKKQPIPTTAPTTAAPRKTYQMQTVAPANGACQYDGLMREVFVEDPEWAVKKMHAESGCDPNIVNPKTCTKNTTLHAKGLMQLCGHADLLQQVCPGRDPNESVFDPNCNVQAAHKLYQGSGRGPWGG
jgi:hypothetical protein